MKNKRASITQAFLCAGVLLLLLGGIRTLKEYLFPSGPPPAFCEAEVRSVESLGDTYGDIKAEEGYSFYEITFQVDNRSSTDCYVDDLQLHLQGEEETDVLADPEWSGRVPEDTLFYESVRKFIPGLQSARVTIVIQAADGITELTAFYLPNAQSGEESLEVSLNE